MASLKKIVKISDSNYITVRDSATDTTSITLANNNSQNIQHDNNTFYLIGSGNRLQPELYCHTFDLTLFIEPFDSLINPFYTTVSTIVFLHENISLLDGWDVGSYVPICDQYYSNNYGKGVLNSLLRSKVWTTARASSSSIDIPITIIFSDISIATTNGNDCVYFEGECFTYETNGNNSYIRKSFKFSSTMETELINNNGSGFSYTVGYLCRDNVSTVSLRRLYA